MICRVIVTTAGMLLLLTTRGAAQHSCKKGIPCGNSCISASKVCHVGTTPKSVDSSKTAPTTSSSTPQLFLSPSNQAAIGGYRPGDEAVRVWIGSKADKVYFRDGCSAALDLDVDNRAMFPSTAAAEAAGYRRSRVPDC